jgi:hypothetical protein
LVSVLFLKIELLCLSKSRAIQCCGEAPDRGHARDRRGSWKGFTAMLRKVLLPLNLMKCFCRHSPSRAPLQRHNESHAAFPLSNRRSSWAVFISYFLAVELLTLIQLKLPVHKKSRCSYASCISRGRLSTCCLLSEPQFLLLPLQILAV